MFGSGIKLKKEVLEKAKRAAAALHCASPAEFIERAVEKEAGRVLAEEEKKSDTRKARKEEISEKLKGLGYIE